MHSKWVYKTKTGADGDLERHKAWLVACGNEQVLGADYSLTFAAFWGVLDTHGDIPNAYVKADKEAHLEI